MHGDFSRATFRPDRHFSAVLAQQGRVQLDADANEQAAIALHLARTMMADLVGRHGGTGTGFQVLPAETAEDDPPDFTIAPGRYYVDGVQIDATRPRPLTAVREGDGDQAEEPAPPDTWTYWSQPHAYLDPENETDALPGEYPYVLYVRAWDTLVSHIQDPAIRETALGPALPDTSARARTVWQVRPLRLGKEFGNTPVEGFWRWVRDQQPTQRLAARAERPARADDDPCAVAPDARYRGPENQLYRVEIHVGGTVSGTAGKRGAARADGEPARPSFKWSRDNGSVTFPIAAVDGAWVTLAALGRDDKLDLHVGHWVEVMDDAYAARGEAGGKAQPLLQVTEVDLVGRRVLLSAEPVAGAVPELHPYLRRWDHSEVHRRGAPRLVDGAVEIREGQWIALEDGVEVWFEADGRYRAGDYWLIPARTISGTVEWPQDGQGRPLLAPAHGIDYHYAPLAWVTGRQSLEDLRRTFPPLAGED